MVNVDLYNALSWSHL